MYMNNNLSQNGSAALQTCKPAKTCIKYARVGMKTTGEFGARGFCNYKTRAHFVITK